MAEVEDEYGAKAQRSLTRDNIWAVVVVLEQMNSLEPTKAVVRDGMVLICDDDDLTVIAEVWWDGEAEMWLADFSRSGEA